MRGLRRGFVLIAGVIAVMICREPAFAEKIPSSVAFGAGVGNVRQPKPAGFGFAEYRLPFRYYGFSPWLGIEGSARELFAGGGVFLNLKAGRFALTPSAGAGYYTHDRGFDLGGHLEFRTGVEFSVGVGKARVGLSFSHYSNAGLGEINPGVEVLKLAYVIPISPKPVATDK